MRQVLQAEECRERAVECARKALEVTEPAFRSMFAELAEQWTRIAEHLEELERRPRGPNPDYGFFRGSSVSRRRSD